MHSRYQSLSHTAHAELICAAHTDCNTHTHTPMRGRQLFSSCVIITLYLCPNVLMITHGIMCRWAGSQTHQEENTVFCRFKKKPNSLPLWPNLTLILPCLKARTIQETFRVGFNACGEEWILYSRTSILRPLKYDLKCYSDEIIFPDICLYCK